MNSSYQNNPRSLSIAISVISFLLILLGIAGFIDCLVIAGTISLADGQCSGLGSCDKVLLSSYASIAGFSLWKLGALFYVLYSALLVTSILKQQKTLLKLCLLMLIGGFSFSLYLIYLQAFVINAWCPLCLISAGIQVVSLLACAILLIAQQWPTENQTAASTFRSFLAASTISACILIALFIMSDKIFGKVENLTDNTDDSSQVMMRIEDQEVYLSDFPEYLTMKQEFDQFVWTKSKQWYRARVLSEQAKKKGFGSSSLYIKSAYTSAGHQIDIDAQEAVRLLNVKKQQYLQSGKTLPSDQVLLAELQREHQQRYDDLSNKLTDQAEKALGAKHLLPPSSVNLAIDPKKVPILGSLTAPIKITIFSDFHCSHCRKMHTVINEIRDELGHEHIQVAYLNHYWEFLPEDLPRERASRTTRAAYAAWQQDKFWEFAELVFHNQDRTDLYSLSDLTDLAKEIRLDITKFETDLASQAANDFIQSHRPLQEQAYAEQPPTIIVNGFFVPSSKSKILRKIAQLNLIPAK